MSSSNGLVTQHDGAVLTLMLNRAHDGNRLDADTLEQLDEQLSSAADDDSTSVVVLKAAGPDFCLGRKPSGAALTPVNLAREFARIQHANELIESSPCITVAALHGRAFGAGLSLAGRCDLVLADGDARLAFPEVPHGIPPTIVLSHYTYALARKPLLDLILTGREIGAEEAQRIGLVSRVVPNGGLGAAVEVLAGQLTSQDQATSRVVKRFVGSLSGVSAREAPAYGIAVYINEVVGRALGEGSHDA